MLWDLLLSKTSGPSESVNHCPLLRSQGLAVDPKWTNSNSPSFQKQWLAEEWACALWKTIRCWVKELSFFKTPVLAKGEEYNSELIGSSSFHKMVRVFLFFCLFFSFFIRKYLKREREKRNRERNWRPSGTNCIDSSTSSNMKFLNLFFELSWTAFENKLNIIENKKVLNKTIILSNFQMSKLKPRKFKYLDLVSKSDLKACLTL